MQRLPRLTFLARRDLGAEPGDGAALLVDLGLQRADVCLLRNAGGHCGVFFISLERGFKLRDFRGRRLLVVFEFGNARIKLSTFLVAAFAGLQRR